MSDAFFEVPEEDAILPCYGPQAPHEPVSLIGTSPALRALRQALDTALDGGQGSCDVWANDGEAYTILVISTASGPMLPPRPLTPDPRRFLRIVRRRPGLALFRIFRFHPDGAGVLLPRLLRGRDDG